MMDEQKDGGGLDVLMDTGWISNGASVLGFQKIGWDAPEGWIYTLGIPLRI